MKANVYERYGSPDVLRFDEVETPTPAGHDVLVRVHAASANAGDWHLLRGTPFLIRLESGLLRPKHTILGADIAGRVEAVGSNVRELQPGDEVFGDISASGYGGFAEYVCVREDALVLKPANVTFEEAAAVPAAALTALQGLRDYGKIQPGQQVLINGASGGVGTFAVQIAKSFGADVTAICSTRNVDMVRSIGADHVIDYTQEDFTQREQRYDLIVDTAANRSLLDYKRVLGPGGIYVLTGGSTARFLQAVVVGAWISKTGDRTMGTMRMRPNRMDLLFLRELLEDGSVVPVIDRRYTLSEVPDAIRHLETGHTKGKTVITVVPDIPA
jgi:NADPH:quinone reductase-like Zn-dependent oxidoreductase